MTEKSRKQQIEEMLALDPTDPFLRYGLAMECVSEGETEEAARRFGELLAAAPDYVPAYFQAAQALIRLGRREEAADMLRRGITVAREQGNHHAGDEMQGLLSGLG